MPTTAANASQSASPQQVVSRRAGLPATVDPQADRPADEPSARQDDWRSEGQGGRQADPRADRHSAALVPCGTLPCTALSILLVDDEPDCREPLARLLRFDGHQVATAASALEALAVVQEQPADVLIVDLGLPDVDGLTLARRVRSMTDLGQPALIALTGHTDPEDIRRARQAGFDLYLAKPLGRAALQRALATLPPARS